MKMWCMLLLTSCFLVTEIFPFPKPRDLTKNLPTCKVLDGSFKEVTLYKLIYYTDRAVPRPCESRRLLWNWQMVRLTCSTPKFVSIGSQPPHLSLLEPLIKQCLFHEKLVLGRDQIQIYVIPRSPDLLFYIRKPPLVSSIMLWTPFWNSPSPQW